MMGLARLIRIQYEDVDTIARQFINESNDTEGTVRVLKQAVEALRGGGWLGEGANAFYDEMDSFVFPNLDKLVNALNTTEQKIREAVAKMHEMEDQQSNKFKALESQMQKYVNNR